MSTKKRNDYELPIEDNPGKRIRQFLELKYEISSRDFLSSVDYDFMADDGIVDIFHKSVINYLLRRIITSAHYINRTFRVNGDIKVRDELRSFFKYHTRLEDSEISMLIPLLFQVLRNSEDDFNQQQKRSMRRLLEEKGWGCFICGRELDFSKNSNEYNVATADHLWPRVLGGESNVGNLRYACSACNNKYKKAFIDYTDYHFEEISMVISAFDEYIDRARDRSYEAAIFAKSNYRCAFCNQPAYRVGELSIGRKSLQDSWHFLNLNGYCVAHKPE